MDVRGARSRLSRYNRARKNSVEEGWLGETALDEERKTAMEDGKGADRAAVEPAEALTRRASGPKENH